MPMKGYGTNKQRNMEKSPASNARPSQGEQGARTGTPRGGTENKNQFKIGKVSTK